MKNVRFLALLLIGLAVIFTGPQGEVFGYDYIYITNPFQKKIPLAVPDFQTANKTIEEDELSLKSSDLLASTLDFTGYFQLLDKGAFLIDPGKQDLSPERINFQNWRTVGAELLITGSVNYQNGVLQMDLRLYDTVKAENLISKRYTGTERQYRQMIQFFCSHVIYYLTSKESIFNTKIIFVSNGSGHKELYTCDFDGYNVQQFTQHQNITLFPAWSSDARHVSYTSFKNGKADLFIRQFANAQGSVVQNEGINLSGAWVPGRFELAATQSFSGDQEIYLLTGNGKMIKRLTNSPDIDTSPTFSPDGKRMAFVSKRSGSPQIYVMDIGSGRTSRLTFSGSYNTQPDWSPMGDKICFSSQEGGQNNIMVINADGSAQQQLTRNAGNNESPSWSPDGNLIVFCSTREGTSRIYVMTAFGTDQRRLVNIPGAQTNPKWSPRININ